MPMNSAFSSEFECLISKVSQKWQMSLPRFISSANLTQEFLLNEFYLKRLGLKAFFHAVKAIATGYY